MPISHIFAQGVGPFKQVHLDLTGPDGKASLGPHILAGVNGSGKSTLLKAVAWCLAKDDDGFPIEEWMHSLRGYSVSRVLVLFDIGTSSRSACAITTDKKETGWQWVQDNLAAIGMSLTEFPPGVQSSVTLHAAAPQKNNYFLATLGSSGTAYEFKFARFEQEGKGAGERLNIAAYSSAKSLRYIEKPDMAGRQETGQPKRFSFDSTVQNEAIQSWLLSLYSKQAIAKERHQSSSRYTASLESLERGMKHVCGDDVSVAVDIEPNFQPGLRIGNKTLNFSQIPDGMRAILGLLADFLMRSEAPDWDPKVESLGPGILLFDEIEVYLHPLWQRQILPALAEALPHTQILVTSHSPFVISSCPDSVIHVLKTNNDGSAYVEPPVKAPIGESITSTLKEIFGVDSRFDVKTQLELDEWNKLNKARHNLGSKEIARFRELSDMLSSRSEELRSLVNPIQKLSKATVDKLTAVEGGRNDRKRSTARR